MRPFDLPVLAALMTGCGSAGGGPPATILITLDTTRADRLGAYGYRAARTPHLDGIAADGALFTDASATAPTTLPSHASILTGLFPPSHGARNNGNHRLPDEVETVTEVFASAGYSTGAFLAAEVLSARYGLDQGFDHYDDDFLHDATAFGDGYRERSAETIVRRALAWMDARRGEPLFCWLHFFDPHFPYQPSSEETHPYDAEIARVDTAVGRLLDALKDWGLYDRTTLVVVADHGEGLGDKGEDTHGLFVYQATIHVPLLLRVPDEIPRGIRIDVPVSTVDIAPTLLDLAGLVAPAGVQGASLRPLWSAPGRERRERAIYFETLLPRYEYMWSNLAGMRFGTDKFISAPTDELYRLQNDPGERTNLIAEEGAARATWVERFEALIGDFPAPPSPGEMALDGATRDKLAALGYGFAPLALDAQAQLPDPKDRHADHLLYRRIQEAARNEDWQGVIELTANGLRGKTLDPYQALFAARARANRKEYEPAEALYRKLLRRFPENTALLRGLASVQFDRGQFDLARETYARLIELDPLHAQHHAGSGDSSMSLGRTAEARAAWEAALVADPYFVKAWNNLGILDAKGGDFESAKSRFERILAIQPDHEQARANLRLLAKDTRE
jgi:arylsulfatase A-like enzyme/Flp pilus assembly protein TadD